MKADSRQHSSSNPSRAAAANLSREDWQARYDEGRTGWDRGEPSPMLRHWLQSDIFTFGQSNRFDAIYEQTSLCAIHPSRWQTYEQLLACWLRPGGKLFALFMQSDMPDGPPFTCEHHAMQRLFASGWQWYGEPQRVDHPSGMHELASIIERAKPES